MWSKTNNSGEWVEQNVDAWSHSSENDKVNSNLPILLMTNHSSPQKTKFTNNTNGLADKKNGEITLRRIPKAKHKRRAQIEETTLERKESQIKEFELRRFQRQCFNCIGYHFGLT